MRVNELCESMSCVSPVRKRKDSLAERSRVLVQYSELYSL